ncbi:MAG: CopG family transcriptional regulator [Anaerolineales bacterium]|jgi:predicted transcriptional regulator
MIRGEFISLRLSADERRRVEQLAEKRGQSRSGLVRELILAEVDAHGLAPASVDASDVSKEKNPR